MNAQNVEASWCRRISSGDIQASPEPSLDIGIRWALLAITLQGASKAGNAGGMTGSAKEEAPCVRIFRRGQR
jgi:hypothetical protein